VISIEPDKGGIYKTAVKPSENIVFLPYLPYNTILMDKEVKQCRQTVISRVWIYPVYRINLMIDPATIQCFSLNYSNRSSPLNQCGGYGKKRETERWFS
jgi:hypothetical protein